MSRQGLQTPHSPPHPKGLKKIGPRVPRIKGILPRSPCSPCHSPSRGFCGPSGRSRGPHHRPTLVTRRGWRETGEQGPLHMSAPSRVGGEGGLGVAVLPTAQSPVETSVSRTRASPQVYGPLVKDPPDTRPAGARTPALPAADLGPTSFSRVENITALLHRVFRTMNGRAFVTALISSRGFP